MYETFQLSIFGFFDFILLSFRYSHLFGKKKDSTICGWEDVKVKK